MLEAGMTLAKWHSNQKEIIDRDSQNPMESTKVLGIQWDQSTDTFQFHGIELPSTLVITKRLILSCIARIFDPLGLLQPYTISAKILFQDIWRLGTEWDDELPEEVSQKFQRWISGLQKIKNWNIPRRYTQVEYTTTEKQLHVFCDASEKAYGAAVYIETKEGLTLVLSRARVAPLKRVTLPRLELLACLIGTKLLIQVKAALFLQEAEYQCWTDSKIALGWIKGEPCKWKQFVANRVQTIQESTDPAHWYYCPGTQNPADLITRGMSSESLVQSTLWLHGPETLKPCDKDFHQTNIIEEAKTQDASLAIKSDVPSDVVINIKNWSRLNKVVRVTAWILRFINNLKQVRRHRNLNSDLSHLELSESVKTLILLDQKDKFQVEIDSIKNKKEVDKSSKLFSLNPFIDQDGILRVRSRIENSSLTYDEKYPIILDKSHLAKLITTETHQQFKHAGVDTVITQVRKKYWIVGLRRLTKNILRNCVICLRWSAKGCNQTSPPLPESRVKLNAPFKTTGVDFAGPLYTSDNPDHKLYIALFTCTVIRAVHLELTSNLTAPEFLHAFRRFAARRGLPSTVLSDNALTFKKAEKMLSNIYGSRTPDYQYIAPRSPWRGGIWERLVRSVKSFLRKSLGQRAVTRTELETLLIEIEYVINSRPITTVTDELGDQKPLTPNDFLLGTSQPAAEIDLNKMYSKKQRTLSDFWKKWSTSYLQNLLNIVPRFIERCTLKRGSIVLVKEDNIPRLKWPLAKVLELYPGQDQKLRTAKLKTATGELVRPVQRLYHLETVTQSDEQSDSNIESPRLAKEDQPEGAAKPAQQKPKPRPQELANTSVKTRTGRIIKPVQKLDL